MELCDFDADTIDSMQQVWPVAVADYLLAQALQVGSFMSIVSVQKIIGAVRF